MATRVGGTGQTRPAREPGTDGTARLAEAHPGQRRPSLRTTAVGAFRTPGTGSSQRWFFSGIWLIYLIQPVADLFGHHHGAAWIVGGIAIAAAFCVIYLPVLLYCERQPRLARAGLVALAVLAALACTVYGQTWTPLWIYVSAAVGMVLSVGPNGRRDALAGILGVGACYVFFSWLAHVKTTDFLAVLLPVLLVGVAMLGFRMQIQLVRDLTQARETVAKLAANEERLRLARDMHDLTGQSLSMITLKSELAAKRLSRLSASAEHDAVLGELGDIGRVSRQTLHDIRAAVSGYRRPTLAIEVITARNALDAAGMRLDDDPELTLRSGTFDSDAEAALAWCLREAVTNVIRHSRARICRVRLIAPAGELSLEVTDDGRGLPGPDPNQAPEAGRGDGAQAVPADPPMGTGLRGMSERVSAVGGRLSLGSAGQGRGRGFRLTATVPVDRYDADA